MLHRKHSRYSRAPSVGRLSALFGIAVPLSISEENFSSNNQIFLPFIFFLPCPFEYGRGDEQMHRRRASIVALYNTGNLYCGSPSVFQSAFSATNHGNRAIFKWYECIPGIRCQCPLMHSFASSPVLDQSRQFPRDSYGQKIQQPATERSALFGKSNGIAILRTDDQPFAC